MGSQSATGLGTWVAARFSALAPEWVRAMFFCYPLARPIYFVPSEQVNGLDNLSQDLLTCDVIGQPKSKRARHIDVFAPTELFLRRTVRVPKGARRKLHASAALDLRQHTPFNLQDILWQLDEPLSKDNFIEAVQWIVKKSDIERWRSRLGKHGYKIRHIFVQGAKTVDPIADFSNENSPLRRPIIITNGFLALSAAALGLATWLYPAWAAQQQSMALHSQVQNLQVRAVDLRREVETLRGQDLKRTAFLDTILHRPLLVDSLHQLTIALPDDVWLATLTFSPERIVMSGETSESAADIVLKLNGHKLLENPSLSGPVQKTAGQAERFEISVDLGQSNL